jgi:hypothetical protein
LQRSTTKTCFVARQRRHHAHAVARAEQAHALAIARELELPLDDEIHERKWLALARQLHVRRYALRTGELRDTGERLV